MQDFSQDIVMGKQERKIERTRKSLLPNLSMLANCPVDLTVVFLIYMRK